jgi:hypothetical protein
VAAAHDAQYCGAFLLIIFPQYHTVQFLSSSLDARLAEGLSLQGCSRHPYHFKDRITGHMFASRNILNNFGAAEFEIWLLCWNILNLLHAVKAG